MFYHFDDEAKNEEMVTYSEQTFESIKHYTDDGQEFWYARELSKVLQYADWRNFQNAIFKAMEACQNSGNDIEDHFGETTNMINLGKSAKRRVEDYALSRYACYLIVMNGDPSKEIIALGQTYFAVKTRQQELVEDYEQLSEDQKRLAIRNEMKRHNSALADAAHDAGVDSDGCDALPCDLVLPSHNGLRIAHSGLYRVLDGFRLLLGFVD